MSWSLEGNYAENCNCDIMCPCLYLQPPTEGFCEAMLVWDIKTGHLNDVKLDGLKVSIWLHAPGPQLTEGGFKIALYRSKVSTITRTKRNRKTFNLFIFIKNLKTFFC